MHLLSYNALNNSIIYRNIYVEEEILKGDIFINFKEKQCIGWKDEYSWNPCPHEEKGTRQCKHCKTKDISKVYTVHNFKGYEYLEEDVKDSSAKIYLVAIGEYLKVGITFSSRIKKRIKEQGADYFSEIMEMPRVEAYEMESFIKDSFSIKERTTEKQKLEQIGKERIAKKNLENLLSLIKEKEPFSSYINNTQIKKVEHSYTPKSAIPEFNINGYILGNKGTLLFFKNDGIKVVPMKEKEGRLFSFKGKKERKLKVNYINL